jgi:hypothetical protein
MAEMEVDALKGLFKTTQVVEGGLDAVRQSEWDALVTREGTRSGNVAAFFGRRGSAPADPHLFVLGFGGLGYGRSTSSQDLYQYGNSEIGLFAQSLAREVRLGWSLTAELERLVRNDLVPKALSQAQHDVIAIGTHPTFPTDKATSLRPFLETSAGEPIAGAFRREGGSADCWILPRYADVEAWARVAIQEWRKLSPDRFPREWFDDARWLTVDEEDVEVSRTKLEADRRDALDAFERRSSELEAHGVEAADRAAKGERRLLTAQGADLVEAVVEALTSIGFEVRDMDLETPEGDRREDLRINAPGTPTWEVIAEVRGYSGGAQLADLMRLTRFARRYRDEVGRSPDACWYICNQFIGAHPGQRPVMLASNPNETREFREDLPLALIDTALLFQFLKRLRRRELSPDEARRALMSLNDHLSMT